MEWIADPTIWVALATLITLEIVLGIDNVVFIAILSEKLPERLRDKARITGLCLALVMRLVLLASLSWLLTLNQPLFAIEGHGFSARELILLLGGIFLLFKASLELTERLEGKDQQVGSQRKTVKFWPVVAQIVVLDAVFSLDSVITAIHIAENNLPIMVTAVVIAMVIMLIASKWLAHFVNDHPTIVILCLSFLLMIGFSLVAEGFGFHIPKEYLYAAITFSVIIEFFNQLARFNRRKYLSSRGSLRERTAEAVLNLLGGRAKETTIDEHSADLVATKKEDNEDDVFSAQELEMIERVLGLAKRTVGSIMTSRHDIEYMDISASQEEQKAIIAKNQHTRLVVTEETATDEPIGVIHVNDLLKQMLRDDTIDLQQVIKQPLVFPERLSLLTALEQFREAQTHFAFVTDEFGSIEGIVTLTDVMETIAGNLPVEGDEIDARHDFFTDEEGNWIVHGYVPIDDLITHVPIPVENKREYYTLAGFLMEYTQEIPKAGDVIIIGDWRFEILQVESHRILQVKIAHVKPDVPEDKAPD